MNSSMKAATLDGLPLEKRHLVGKVIAGRADLADLLGLKPTDLESLYGLGHGYYSAGQYDQALIVFRFLCVHRPRDWRFWMGLAATCQLDGRPEAALVAYLAASKTNPAAIEARYRVAECLLTTGQKAGAAQVLAALAALPQVAAENASWQDRARRMLARLQAEA